MHAVQMLISLMASTTTTTTPNPSNSKENGQAYEAKMQKLWAEAYDAWVNVPGSSDRVLYFKPVAIAAPSSSSPSPSPSRSLHVMPIPQIVQQSVLFGITACDPMGVVEVDPNVNAAANERLELVLKSIMMTTTTTSNIASSSSTTTTPPPMSTTTPRCSTYWHGFGLSSDDGHDGGGRIEAGYIVAFPKSCILVELVAEAAEAAMVALAKDFNQGAIYRFDYLQEQGMLRRKTISAAMSSNVEADVVIVRCEKPNDIAAIPDMDDDDL